MAVWYLDIDDEITDAVARLRAATDEHVVFVVPPGSRIATGRINFKLLAREATSRDLTLAIASQDEQVRALATSAGVLARHSVDEAEASLARGDTVTAAPESATDPASPTDASSAGTSGTAAAGTVPLAGSVGSAAATGSRTRPRGRRLTATVVAVLALVVVGGVLSLQMLPTAEISLRPRSQPIGPIDLAVTALVSAKGIDPVAAEVPATAISIPLSVGGTFAASGAATVASRAAGEVLFASEQQTFDQEIAAGTRVRTSDGIEFQTTEGVVLERPEAGEVAQASAPVEAIEAGPEGNVPIAAISVVPSLESQGIGVSNPRPTTGGRLQQTPIVTQADFDAATVDLRNRLTGTLATRLRQPDVAPDGLTVYPETARLGSISHQPGASDIVGSSAARFDLRATTVAEVLAVDVEDVEAAFAATLESGVPADMTLLPTTLRIEVEEGRASEDQIDFQGSATGVAYVPVDAAAVTAQVAGMPVSEARAILEALGAANVEVWPDFLGDLPGDPARISLTVLEPSTTE